MDGIRVALLGAILFSAPHNRMNSLFYYKSFISDVTNELSNLRKSENREKTNTFVEIHCLQSQLVFLSDRLI